MIDPAEDIGLYIMDKDHNPVRAKTVDAWCRWRMVNDHHVADIEVAPGVRVLTVFLGVDHRFSFAGRNAGPPILFETMVFDDYGGGNYQTRCCTWIEAEAQHDAAVAWLRRRMAREEVQEPPTLAKAIEAALDALLGPREGNG